jgi:methyl-accepting chemotaxis protein
MKPIKFLQKNSIATQLIKIVFGFYCIVALTITIIQISIEYQHTRQSVENELAINQQIFEPVLSAGIWNLDDEQVMNTLNGMMAIPIIIGVKIEKKEQNYKAIGIVKTKSGQQKKYDAHGMGLFILENEYKDVFSYQFPIHYVFRGEPRKVGTATLYSNSSVIIDRVKIGIILLIINAVIKTIALWLLFFWVGKRILLTPLNKLVQAIENVNFDDLDELKIDLKNKRENELTIIENAFSDMLKNLADARIELIKSRLILEEKVKLRTHDLQRAKLEAERANEVKTEFMSQISHV